MKVSYKWLNEFVDGKLPPLETAENVLTMNSNEVDGIEEVGNDYVLDVKILPNMAHSCLCHRGIAKEYSVLLNLPMEKYSRKFLDITDTPKSNLDLQIKIENPNDCRRYIGRVVEGIKIAPSPVWLKNRLETLGQRSINNLVDATNFVMLEIGQPMHVFDADKLGGSVIEIKKAKVGDEMFTLDGKQVILDDSVLVISNNSKALAIAGIKGGTLAEIGPETKNIVLESANFNPVLIRKTAQKIKIQTDASKRYENDYSPELATEAMDILTRLIIEIAGTEDTKIGEMVDAYPNKAIQNEVSISAIEASKIVGVDISEEEIINIFDRFNFTYRKEKDRFVVIPPAERLDLKIKEDLAEEIGRVYGYGKIKDIIVPKAEKPAKPYKAFNCKNQIRNILLAEGFSEIINYTFTDKGDIEVANPISPERRFLRKNLTDGLKDSLEFNARYSELIEMPQIRVFEFGHVFDLKGESERFILGIKNSLGLKSPKEKEVLDSVVKILSENLGLVMNKINSDENIFECDFTEMLKNISEPQVYDFSGAEDKGIKFQKISQYPFVVRDVAVFTPEGTKQEEVWKIIEEKASDLLVKYRLFDVFTKKFPDGSAKTSYAFRLVLQSYDHTLSEEEISLIMKGITDSLNTQKDWQVR